MTLEELFTVRAGDLPRVTELEMADVGAAINRRLDEIHVCMLCGERAAWPSWPTASDLFGEAAWLDLCPGHDLDLRSMLIADPFLDDAKIIRHTKHGRTLAMPATPLDQPTLPSAEDEDHPYTGCSSLGVTVK